MKSAIIAVALAGVVCGGALLAGVETPDTSPARIVRRRKVVKPRVISIRSLSLRKHRARVALEAVCAQCGSRIPGGKARVEIVIGLGGDTVSATVCYPCARRADAAVLYNAAKGK